MQPGLVSIMMPAYNAEPYIGQAIESALAQSYSTWELVIVDDGSSDRTGEIAAGYADPRIKLVRQLNRGEAAARNTALRNIQGEYLAFLDADDLYLPHHLESLVQYLSGHAHRDGVYTDGYYIDQSGKRLQTLSSRRRGPFEGDLFEKAVYASDIFGPPVCVMLRTGPIQQHGLAFDENIVIGPDWDFFVKYAAQGTFGYVDQISCLYRLHTSNVSVRVGLEKRAGELSKCRMNAVKMKGFAGCSAGVQTAVFYDLLVNLLTDFPEQQTEITKWDEFRRLAPREQARLLRLMAGRTIVHGSDQSHVQEWLDRARQLYPGDWRSIIMSYVHAVLPGLLQRLLKVRDRGSIDPRSIPPFWDMKLDSNR